MINLMQTNHELLADRYRLEEKIASGGMGSVYRALDERLDRAVAVKMLRDHLVGDEWALERFRREARAVAALTHTNIARVFDLCEDSGRHFIVMELIEGRDISEVLRAEGALGPERATHIAAQVCGALAESHSLGIVHRDIKPANILIGPGDFVKVTDFGIARAADDGTLTASGIFLGTVNYVAPEVAEGKEATPLSDIYSLGVVLFEITTGFPPFEADSPAALLSMHEKGEIPSPSSRRADVPAYLDEAVHRATARDPASRWPSAAELKEHLEAPSKRAGAPTIATALGDAEPTSEHESIGPRAEVGPEEKTAVAPASSPSSGPAPASRRTWLVGLMAAVVLLLVAIVPELLSPAPVGVRSPESTDRRATETGGAAELPASLEEALQRLEKEVRP